MIFRFTAALFFPLMYFPQGRKRVDPNWGLIYILFYKFCVALDSGFDTILNYIMSYYLLLRGSSSLWIKLSWMRNSRLAQGC